MENRSGLKVLAVVVLLVVSNYISWNVGKSGGLSGLGGQGGATVTLPAPGPIPGGVRNLGGIVESVSDSGFTLKLSAADPFASKGPSVRNVSVDERTVIERLLQKDNATIQKEQTAFMEKLKKAQEGGSASADSAPLTPPEPFTREKISLSDIKAGDMVLVFADEDISIVKQFIAAKVSLQPGVNLPPASAAQPE